MTGGGAKLVDDVFFALPTRVCASRFPSGCRPRRQRPGSSPQALQLGPVSSPGPERHSVLLTGTFVAAIGAPCRSTVRHRKLSPHDVLSTHWSTPCPSASPCPPHRWRPYSTG